jgi:hypothetical protein
MKYMYAIQKHRLEVVAEEKVIEDVDTMQAAQGRWHQGQTSTSWSSSTYAMWEMLENVACFAERRKDKALARMNHYLWLRERIARERG